MGKSRQGETGITFVLARPAKGYDPDALYRQPQGWADSACTPAIAYVAFEYIVALDTYIAIAVDIDGLYIDAAGRPEPPPPDILSHKFGDSPAVVFILSFKPVPLVFARSKQPGTAIAEISARHILDA